MNKEAVFQALKAGDRRSIGRSNQVVSIMRRQPALFSALIDGMYHDDELVRMRAADAAEKLTITNPQWLRPFKRRLISLARRVEQQELRWHLAQMLPRLELPRQDRMVVASILRGYLKDNSRIVKTFGMQGLADLAAQESPLLAQVPSSAGDINPRENRQSSDEKPWAETVAPTWAPYVAPEYPRSFSIGVQVIGQSNLLIFLNALM
jgi:hypothetical protein